MALFFSHLYSQETDVRILREETSNYKVEVFPEVTSEFTEAYDLKYYRFEWYVDPQINEISGTATAFFEIVSDGTDVISFDFSKPLVVDSIMWHGQKVEFDQSETYRLDVQLPMVLQKGMLDSLSVTYHGTPRRSGFGSFNTGKHGNTPILWTLCAPYGARDWWPCKNGNDDKIDSLDMYVTTPSPYVVAGNGLLISETQNDNQTTTFHWKHKYAIAPYLVAIAVTNYERYYEEAELSDGTILPIYNYVYPESLAQAQAGTQRNIEILQFYDSLFVSYPFKNEKYGHAQFGWGGGMENQTMSHVTDFSRSLLAHELAHQWFGDFVTCKTWEDSWLNEGMATYAEGLTHERFPLTSVDWYNWKRDIIKSVTSRLSGSVKVSQINDYKKIFEPRLIYDKGAFLAHMTRWVVGDEAFFNGLRGYLNTYAYNHATTDDFRYQMEMASGFDLSSFFEKWFEGQGYPRYQIRWSQQNNRLLIKVNQTTTHASVEFFEMPIELQLKGETQDEFIRLDHHFDGQIFEMDTDFEIAKIVFDPRLWLISGNNTIKYDEELTSLTEDFYSNINIFPNPGGDRITLISDRPIFDSFDLCDINGRVLFSGTITDKTTEIDTQILNSGTYFISLKKDKMVKIVRWMKQ